VQDIASEIRRWREQGEPFALATVVATRRSAPRPIGSTLAVSKSGQLCGSVSGGCVENEVYGNAQEVLAGGEPRLLSYGISDDLALSVGLPCGGEIDVFVEEADPALLDRLIEVAENGDPAVRLTVIGGEDVGSELLVLESGETLGAGPRELAQYAQELIRGGRSQVLELEGRTVFADVYGPPPTLIVYGAVDTAESLCRQAKALGWHTVVADARGKFATRERLPSADEIVVAWPDEAFAQVGLDYTSAVVVLTHDDKFDVPALGTALASDAFYVGALGSRRNQERRRERLLEAGVDEELLERMSGPCGLDIGASTPAETALSILAEILARRARRDGGSLKESSGRIHADV
jgi:xanthine dehydrogenase accessory factor